jgi:hypothetical protein
MGLWHIIEYKEAEELAAKCLNHFYLSDIIDLSFFPDGELETLIYLIQNSLIEIPEHVIPEA